jgi:subtilase family serine protease
MGDNRVNVLRRTDTRTSLSVLATSLEAFMSGRSVTTRSITVGAAATLVCGALVGSAAPAAAVHRDTPAIGVHPHIVRAGTPHPSGSVVFGCQTPAAGHLQCYGPDQIRAAYAIQPLLNKGITGKGRTIVIIDAFSPPGVASDLATFDAAWGLADPNLTIIAPQGTTPFDINDPDQNGWAGEIDLDTQWSHVVAPGANIVLVEAKTDDDADILAATQYAVKHQLGDVISQSFGEDERCVDPSIARAQHQLFTQATAQGITLIASTGDEGAALPTCDGSSYSLAASSPAVDPLVLAVGGTSLTADGVTGAYGSETVWNESDEFGAAGGGGYSVLVRRPAYQDGLNHNTGRGVPDVSYNAGINGGVIAFDGQDGAGGNFYIFGGTSSGSPQWAGLTVLAAQLAHRRLGSLNPALYAVGRTRLAPALLRDITVGDNTYSFVNDANVTVTIPGYAATRGWDAASGLGTPIASGVVPYLALVG